MKPKIAVSSCLIGHEVRYDAGHKNNRYLADVLSRYFDYQPICPEVGIGLGIPRPTIRLVDVDGEVRVRQGMTKEGEIASDYTDEIQAFARKTLPDLRRVCGYIFKRILLPAV